MKKYKFHEVVIGIDVLDIKEGDVLIATSGAKAVLKNGVLTWVTTGGYASTPVAVSIENMNELFILEKEEDKVEYSFSDAVHLLGDGLEMKMVVEGREYTVSSYDDLDSIVETQEYFADVVSATFLALQSDLDKLPTVTADKAPAVLAEIDNLTKGGKKVTEDDAYVVLNQYHNWGTPVVKLADDFEVSPRMIYYILDGTHWTAVYNDFHSINKGGKVK